MFANIKKNKWCYLLSIIQFILGISSFIYGYYYICSNKKIQLIDINNMLQYFRLLSLDSVSLVIKILFHNFLIAIISYILNTFSFGIYGCITMVRSAFIVGYVIKIKEVLVTIFAMLELFGVIISCFSSNCIFNIISKDKIKIKKVCVITLVTVIILLILYTMAGYIEMKYIINILNKEV